MHIKTDLKLEEAEMDRNEKRNRYIIKIIEDLNTLFSIIDR